MADRLDTPLDTRRRWLRRPRVDSELVGNVAEGIARFTGTPRFLVYLTAFCIGWIAWNTLAPANLRFDSAALGLTARPLMPSLQATYASPAVLLAPRRPDDRDRVAAGQVRQRAARILADPESLARELAALRLALGDVATRHFVRSELRALLEELRQE